MGNVNINIQKTSDSDYLTSFKLCESGVLDNSKPTSDFPKQSLTIFHQNIRGLKNKLEEFMNNIATNPPLVLCLTEHHLETNRLNSIHIQNYKLGAHFCRTNYRNGGACIYIHESLQFSNVDTQKYCKEKDFEACTVKLSLQTSTIIVGNS